MAWRYTGYDYIELTGPDNTVVTAGPGTVIDDPPDWIQTLPEWVQEPAADG